MVKRRREGAAGGVVRKRMKRGKMEEDGRYGRSWRKEKLDFAVVLYFLCFSLLLFGLSFRREKGEARGRKETERRKRNERRSWERSEENKKEEKERERGESKGGEEEGDEKSRVE
ncbi:hypothetical protein RF55_9968 [Lasius niger]|uniref:Uncharacterized protein n=1 Tax=Lasius niger TaxID=67767 RepID=A0A0J7KJ66_LASNI|nr:hypothetical protein RF55_9968 [Lasius niger]